MSFDKRTRSGRRKPCHRCGEVKPGESIQITVKAASRLGRQKDPDERGSRTRTFCEVCAEPVWECLEGTLLNAALPSTGERVTLYRSRDGQLLTEIQLPHKHGKHAASRAEYEPVTALLLPQENPQ